MFKSLIYIEKSIAKSKATQKIIDKIQPETILWIDHYKEVLNQSNAHWMFNKKYQKIILAQRQNEFYYKGAPLTSSLGFKHFYYNTLAINCLYHCEYCYLQGMYNTPHLVLFLNNHDFIQATAQLIHQLNDKLYLALSYDTDLLALEQYYPYCKEWIEFAQQEKNIVIEIRTKSYQIDVLQSSSPSHNVILSFTLSPTIIQKKYEPFTPTLEQRLKAVKQAIHHGFQTMLCFDPIIYIPHFQKIYQEFFDTIFSEISHKDLYAISIGVFRMNSDFFKRIRKSGNTSDIYLYPYESKQNITTYPSHIKNEMLMFVKKELMKRHITQLHIYE